MQRSDSDVPQNLLIGTTSLLEVIYDKHDASYANIHAIK